MLLVVFGAGASYDSVPHARPSNPPSGAQTDFSPTSPYVAPKLEEDRPPLANQLFDNRPIFVDAMRRFKDCMAIAPYLRKPGISVEQELARLQGQAEKFAHVHREIAAVHYYLHSALAECQKEWRKHHPEQRTTRHSFARLNAGDPSSKRKYVLSRSITTPC